MWTAGPRPRIRSARVSAGPRRSRSLDAENQTEVPAQERIVVRRDGGGRRNAGRPVEYGGGSQGVERSRGVGVASSGVIARPALERPDGDAASVGSRCRPIERGRSGRGRVVRRTREGRRRRSARCGAGPPASVPARGRCRDVEERLAGTEPPGPGRHARSHDHAFDLDDGRTGSSRVGASAPPSAGDEAKGRPGRRRGVRARRRDGTAGPAGVGRWPGHRPPRRPQVRDVAIGR